MSLREAAEQGACNDCNGGAYLPYDAERPPGTSGSWGEA
jgi:hypothetical protein